jgi:hypothetical protein
VSHALPTKGSTRRWRRRVFALAVTLATAVALTVALPKLINHAKQVSLAASSPSAAIDGWVSGRAAGRANRSLTTAGLTTTHGGDVLVAVVSSDGPQGGSQSVTAVSGAGLAWHRALNQSGRMGVTSIWFAVARRSMTGATFSARRALGGWDGLLTVVAVSGANTSAPVEAAAARIERRGAPSVGIDVPTPGSLVVGGGNDWENSIARTAFAGQILVSQYVDTRVHDTYWTQRTSVRTLSANQRVVLGDSAPTADQFNIAAVAVRPAGARTPAPSPSSVPSPASSATARPSPTLTSTSPPTPTPTPSTSLPPTPRASCPARANQPGGSDPWGGCWPGPDNTGVPAGTNLVSVSSSRQAPPNPALPSDNRGWTYSSSDGEIVVSQQNAVIDGVLSSGVAAQAGASFTMKNSLINGVISSHGDNGPILIENSTINGGSQLQDPTVGVPNVTVKYSNVYGGKDEVNCEGNNCDVENSWLHDTFAGPASGHQQGFFSNGGAGDTLVHNSIYCTSPGCTADVTFGNGYPLSGVKVANNLLVASPNSSYCAYTGPDSDPVVSPVSDVLWEDNVFQKGANGTCGNFGVVYAWFPSVCSPLPCRWIGNIWDNGSALTEP